MLSVDDIRFTTYIRIVDKLGCAKDALLLASAALRDILYVAERNGHCGRRKSEVKHEMYKQNGLYKIDKTVSFDNVLLRCANYVVDAWECRFTKHMYNIEKKIAVILTKRIESPPHWTLANHDIEAMIDNVCASEHIVLSESQTAALWTALTTNTIVITGGAGVGKTTLIRIFLQIVTQFIDEDSILLLAPTGIAAHRLSTLTKRRAYTIHVMLSQQSRKKTSRSIRVFVVDEISMIDSKLFLKLLDETVGHQCHLVLIGDDAQLPSIAAGNILADLKTSTMLKICELREVQRQSHASGIVVNAQRVRTGLVPDLCNHSADFEFIDSSNIKDVLRAVPDIVHRQSAQLSVNAIRDILVITHKNCDVDSLNVYLRQYFNTQASTEHDQKNILFDGDKVMQTRNNYQKNVYNGEIGFVCKRECQCVDFEGRVLQFCEAEFREDLKLAYANTVHKSQGLEFAVVIIVLHRQPFFVTRNLLYTAITRATRKVVLISTKTILDKIVRECAGLRCSALKYELK